MKIQVYTAAWCRDCRAAKYFLDSHGVPYTEINIEDDPAASAEVIRQVGKRAIPQLVIDGVEQPVPAPRFSATPAAIPAAPADQANAAEWASSWGVPTAVLAAAL